MAPLAVNAVSRNTADPSPVSVEGEAEEAGL
jgi:hypothetical protein